jgi:hypothetical protein
MNRCTVPIMLAALAAVTSLHAAPADYVFLPAVTYGEREIDFKAGSARDSGEPRESAASLGFGYGGAQGWFTEAYAKYERVQGEALSFDAWEWENKFQLTETGEYPADLGFIVEIERPQDRDEGYEVRLGPLLQKEFDRVQLNLNLLFARHFRANATEQSEFGYQWQAKYRWQPRLEYGLQGFGDVARWNHWGPADEQSHRLGPAAFGKIGLGGRQAIRYNAAWLFGASEAAPAHTLRVQVEYEF